MFRHVALFTWTEDATQEQQQMLADELRKLPVAIPELRAYHIGPDAGVNTGNFAFAVVADFDSVQDYLVYRDHPVHREVIEQHIRPIMATRAAVQYEIDQAG
jgi:Stress responsive A/B Barrel Domain